VRAKDIAVIVPYFQRTTGILRRALISIAEQRGVDMERLVVVVVDDESPVAAAAELAGFDAPFNTRVVRQSHAGPGAARNAGLDELGADVSFVAFLDSDDMWMPDHLAAALAAINTGGTFFFANFFQLRAQVPAFERAGRLRLEDHKPMPDGVFLYRGNMLEQIFCGNLIGTPTVVFAFRSHSRLRFDTNYRRAGEDYLMWARFAVDGARFVFRAVPSVRCGEGVNSHAGVEWGTRAFLERARDEIAYRRCALRTFDLSPSTRRALAARIRALRADYWRNTLSLLLRRPGELLGRGGV
jgi:succinoglycan biosynthesis protein ExoW